MTEDGNLFLFSQDTNFTQVSNSVIENPEVSWKAKGIYSYLKRRGTYNGWQINLKDIMNHSKDGRDSLRAGVKELQQAGYLAIGSLQEIKSGKFKGHVWYIFNDVSSTEPEEPIDIKGFRIFFKNKTLTPENRNVDNPHLGKSPPINKDISNKDNNKRKPFAFSKENATRFYRNPNKQPDNPMTEQWERFVKWWDIYKHGNRLEAWVAWCKLRPDDETCNEIMAHTPKYFENCEDCDREKRYGATFLNNLTWENGLPEPRIIKPEVRAKTKEEYDNLIAEGLHHKYKIRLEA